MDDIIWEFSDGYPADKLSRFDFVWNVKRLENVTRMKFGFVF